MPTYLELERSRSQSRPIILFHFFRGTEDWFYTSSKFLVSFDSDVYEPLEIEMGQIEYGGQDKPGALPVTIPTDSDLGLVLQSGSAPTPIQLVVIRLQRDASGQPTYPFIGELGGADVDVETMTIQCWPFESQLDLVVPQGLYQRDQCQWNTYDPFTCKVVKATFTFTGTVADIDGLNITVTGATAFDPGTGTREDMFAGGILQFGERQGMIRSQVGDVVTLHELVPGLIVGSTVDLIAGDDRTLATCFNKFANSARRLAFPDLPVENPFFGQGLRQ